MKVVLEVSKESTSSELLCAGAFLNSLAAIKGGKPSNGAVPAPVEEDRNKDEQVSDEKAERLRLEEEQAAEAERLAAEAEADKKAKAAADKKAKADAVKKAKEIAAAKAKEEEEAAAAAQAAEEADDFDFEGGEETPVEVTIDDCRALVKKAVDARKRDFVVKAFNSAGANNFGDLPKEKYASFCEYLTEALSK